MNVVYLDGVIDVVDEAKGLTTTNAGGKAYNVDDLKALKRFFILGADRGTFYIDQKTLVAKHLKNIAELVENYPDETLDMIVDISDRGLAYSNDPAILGLAFALSSKNVDTRRKAAAIVASRQVLRIPTHLFTFITFANELRGWGNLMKTALTEWYTTQDPKKLAYAVTKYQSRTVQGETWSHLNVLQKIRPKVDGELDGIFHYITRGSLEKAVGESGAYLAAVEEAKTASKERVIQLIREFNFPHEVVPNQLKDDIGIWNALLETMPAHALLRNLGNMAKIGLLTKMSESERHVVNTLLDEKRLKKSRVHPLDIMKAKLVYASGAGIRGAGYWDVNRNLVAALEDAFYLSFGAVAPTNKNILMALDVSKSMTWKNVGNIEGLTPRVAAAILAMVNARVEPHAHFVAYSHELIPVDITRNDSLEQVVKTMEEIPYGATNCELPIRYAIDNKLDVDAFVSYTDSETRGQNPARLLREFRERKPNAKHVVVAMEANFMSIADPTDRDSLDVAGFSTDVPTIISSFIGGDI